MNFIDIFSYFVASKNSLYFDTQSSYIYIQEKLPFNPINTLRENKQFCQSSKHPSFEFLLLRGSSSTYHTNTRPSQRLLLSSSKDSTIYPLIHEIFSQNGQTIYPYTTQELRTYIEGRINSAISRVLAVWRGGWLTQLRTAVDKG